MFDSIETYEKYKNNKKLLKELQKKKESFEKRKEFYKREKEKYMAKQELLYDQKSAKRLERDKKKINTSREKISRKLQWKKPLKKHEKEVKIWALKKELYKQIQLLARLQEVDKYWYGKCISCWKRVHRTEADGWHYISRSHMATAFDLRNIHLQCKYCNWWLRWNIVEYRKNLIEQFGEDLVLDLEAKKNETKEFTKEELEALIEQTKWLIELEKEKLI